MDQSGRLGKILEPEKANALLSWLLTGFVLLVIPLSIATGNPLWAGFAAIVALLALVPYLAYRQFTVMLPWEVLLLAALPLVSRTFATVPITGLFWMYLAVAAVALIVAVELHAFTPVRMTSSFAILFVVITTMGSAGVWAVARWLIDITFGTGFILDPILTESEIETRLMWEFVYSTLAGLVAGLVFELYFRRRIQLRDRLPQPPEVSES